MEARKLLIADSNEDFRLALAYALQDHCQILCCTTGPEALALLRREQPDLFVLDLMLPQLDGLTLLEQAAAESIRPKILVVTSMITDYVLASAQRLGIGYIMRKPCDIQAAAIRIMDLSRSLHTAPSTPDPEKLVREMLGELHISSKYHGYNYLCKAIVLMEQDTGQAITKILYPTVAKRCGCQAGHVERSIRNAIDKAWENRDPVIWQHYFPGSRKPSNGAFIGCLAEKLHQKKE